MEKVEFRAVIKFLTKQEKTPLIIMKYMSSVYGDSCYGKSMNYKWHSFYFKQGRYSIKDDQRFGRPIEATSSDMLKKLKNLFLETLV